MLRFIIEYVIPLIGTFSIGVAGWFVTHFVAKPVLDFFQLRKRVVHAVIAYRNVDPERTIPEHIKEAILVYRDLGASVYALAMASPRATRWLLERRLGFDLAGASANLLGLSNDFHKTLDGSRRTYRERLEGSLKVSFDLRPMKPD